MTTYTNLLSEETAKMERGIGGWTGVSNAVVTHAVRISPFPVTLGSEVDGNSIKVEAVADGDVEVVTERFPVDDGDPYRQFVWVGAPTMPKLGLGIRYYATGNILLSDIRNLYAEGEDGLWSGYQVVTAAPENAIEAEMYISFTDMTAGQHVRVARPSVMQQADLTPLFVDYVFDNIPAYIRESDDTQVDVVTGTIRPLARYVTLASKQMSETMEDIISWDYLHKVDSPSGTPDTSSLVDPFKADPEWLTWLAQLMGVSLDTVPTGGRSPWIAFSNAGIDTWTEWEESVDMGSIPGIADTEWVDIETYSPDYFDTETARRLQIASGFNGVLGGTSESIVKYVSALLNTDNPDPFVYVVKHYATNPYRILVATLITEDPDPGGNMLELAIGAATPAGTDVETGHGVSVTANTHYTIPAMYDNMWDDISRGGHVLPTRIVENGAASGRHIALATITGSTEPFYGGEIALARWFRGFALYSGAVKMSSDTHANYNILGDIDIRILLSNVKPPSTGTLRIAESPGKWAIDVTSTETVVFSWENSGTNTVESTAPVAWGSDDAAPFWLRVTLDVNDNNNHTVEFSTAKSLVDETWSAVGDPVTNTGTTGIDSVPASIELLGNGTDPTDGAAAFIYRFVMYDGIDGSLAVDINLTGEFELAESTVNTGTPFIKLPVTNVLVSVDKAPVGSTNLVESTWTAQAHRGGDDYFYLGKSPYAYDNSNGTGLGDTLVFSRPTAGDFDWTMTLLDGTQLTGSESSVTSITWDADTYGGNAITNIVVRDTGVTKGSFTPDLLEGMLTVNTDSYGADWAINRSWHTADFYEYSAFVDRDYLTPTWGDGVFTSGLVFDVEETVSVAASVRRFWSGSGITTIVDQTTGSGWQLRYNGDNIEAIVTDGTTSVTLSYDEVAGNTLGLFTLVTLRRDVTDGTISLWINDAEEDSVQDPFIDGGPFPVTGGSGTVGDSATNKFDLRYLGIFDRALSGLEISTLFDEMARLVYVLPQAAKLVTVDAIVDASPTVYTLGFFTISYLDVPVIASVSTVHEPSITESVYAAFIASGNSVFAPQLNFVVAAPVAATAATLYGPTVDTTVTVSADSLSAAPSLYEPTVTQS